MHLLKLCIIRVSIKELKEATSPYNNNNNSVLVYCTSLPYRTMQYLVKQYLRTSTSRALSSLRHGYDSGAIIISAHLSRARNRELMANCEDRHSQTYSNAAVAADAEQCSEIGVSILHQGGSAVDAVIAAMLSVGVINLHSTGIGGGGFMVIYNSKSRTSYATDFRDKAPLNASTFMFDGIPDLESRHGIRRDDSEKIESLKSDFFWPCGYSLTIQLKCKM